MAAQLLRIHPVTPQKRLVSQAAAALRAGALVVYPTDSSYAFGCTVGNKGALDRIRNLRAIEDEHPFSLVCRDLSELSLYAKVDNIAYRLLKAHTPGPFTFILPATKDVPRRLQDAKRRSVGLRVPDHVVTQALLEALGEPLMSATLKLDAMEPSRAGDPVSELDDFEALLRPHVDLILDAGACGLEPTTIVDLTDSGPTVLRQGRGIINSV